MTRSLLLFEDAGWSALRPLTDVLPVPALAFGASTLAARWERRTQAKCVGCEARASAIAAWRQAPQADPARRESDDLVLVANAAALPGPWLDRALASERPALWQADDRIAGAWLPWAEVAPGRGKGERFERFLAERSLPVVAVEARMLRWPWQLVEWNDAALDEDLATLEPGSLGQVHPLAAILEPSRVRVERGARVDPHVVLDAREGAIHLGEGVIVKPQTVVVGPCVVGAGTELLGGSISHSTIGPGCRLAGEVDSTIWQGWANKRHHGFVGHSVVGEWTNLGALTTTSDLKNNYGTVRVWVDGREMDSGIHKIGSLMGAHVKTGIGSLLATGASIGTGSNLFGGGRFAPKHVPPFSWWDGERSVEHRIDRFLDTARIALSRRGLTLEPAEEAALRSLHAASEGERRRFARDPSASGVSSVS